MPNQVTNSPIASTKKNDVLPCCIIGALALLSLCCCILMIIGAVFMFVLPPMPTAKVSTTPVVQHSPVPLPTEAPSTTSCTRRLMTVNEAMNLIDATRADVYADSLTVLFGRQVDTQCLQDSTSSVGGWQISGPAVILTDPGHQPITGARVVKTWQYQTDWIFGVYFCPAGTTCTVPTPGRAVYLDGNLPETYLH